MKQAKHFSMIRDFHLADWLTLGNAGCGVAAVFAVMSHLQGGAPQQLLVASALVVVAFVLDVFPVVVLFVVVPKFFSRVTFVLTFVDALWLAGAPVAEA